MTQLEHSNVIDISINIIHGIWDKLFSGHRAPQIQLQKLKIDRLQLPGD